MRLFISPYRKKKSRRGKRRKRRRKRRSGGDQKEEVKEVEDKQIEAVIRCTHEFLAKQHQLQHKLS